MNNHHKPKTLFGRLKDYYQIAEREASESVPFYVTGDGVLVSDPKEIIRTKVVKRQLVAFESLRGDLAKENSTTDKLVSSSH